MPVDQSQFHKHKNPEYCYYKNLKGFECHLSQTQRKTKFTLIHKKCVTFITTHKVEMERSRAGERQRGQEH